jgi:hypothetical protein
MFDRQLLGDVVLAALIALPVAALARPDAGVAHRTVAASTPQHKSVVVLASAADRQIGLYR